jgi:hypothetical protein
MGGNIQVMITEIKALSKTLSLREHRYDQKAKYLLCFLLGDRYIQNNGSFLVWFPGQNKRIAPLSFLHECRKRRQRIK